MSYPPSRPRSSLSKSKILNIRRYSTAFQRHTPKNMENKFAMATLRKRMSFDDSKKIVLNLKNNYVLPPLKTTLLPFKT